MAPGRSDGRRRGPLERAGVGSHPISFYFATPKYGPYFFEKCLYATPGLTRPRPIYFRHREIRIGANFDPRDLRFERSAAAARREREIWTIIGR